MFYFLFNYGIARHGKTSNYVFVIINVRCKAYFERELAIHSVTSTIVVAGPSQGLKMVNSSRRQNRRGGGADMTLMNIVRLIVAGER